MKRKNVFLTVLIVLVAAAVGIAVWQGDNLSALYRAATMSQEELLQDMEDRQEKQKKRLAENGSTVPTPSGEDLQALLDGKLTKEELIERLGLAQWLSTSASSAGLQGDGEASITQDGEISFGQSRKSSAESSAGPTILSDADPSESSAQTAQQASDGGEQAGVSPEDLYNQCVAELYACQASVMAQLGGVKANAIARWEALPPESKTSTAKREIGFDALDACYALEGAVDDQVQGILARYRPQIAAAGGNVGSLDELWSYYQDVKNAEKAYYVNQYM